MEENQVAGQFNTSDIEDVKIIVQTKTDSFILVAKKDEEDMRQLRIGFFIIMLDWHLVVRINRDV